MIVVNRTAIPIRMLTSSTTWNRAACRGRSSLPHGQPKYCAATYAEERPVSIAAPKVVAKNARIAAARPSLPSVAATGSATCARLSSWTFSGW